MKQIELIDKTDELIEKMSGLCAILHLIYEGGSNKSVDDTELIDAICNSYHSAVQIRNEMKQLQEKFNRENEIEKQ